MRIFIGFDPRQPIAFTVLQHSLYTRASRPLSITRLQLNQLPLKRVGLTEFTFSRFLVPYICGYEGRALFVDADMLCLSDICEIMAYADSSAVQVVKNKLRFEWPSVMLFNNAECTELTPEFIEREDPFKMNWGEVGELPPEWNHLVGYDAPQDAKLIHYTKGVPVWEETANCEYAKEWHDERRMMMGTCSYQELMGNSVHASGN
jgi:hypothetical protein